MTVIERMTIAIDERVRALIERSEFRERSRWNGLTRAIEWPGKLLALGMSGCMLPDDEARALGETAWKWISGSHSESNDLQRACAKAERMEASIALRTDSRLTVACRWYCFGCTKSLVELRVAIDLVTGDVFHDGAGISFRRDAGFDPNPTPDAH